MKELLLQRFFGGFPAGDASREVLHVGVAKLTGSVGGGLVSAAGWATAIGDDEGIRVSRQGAVEA